MICKKCGFETGPSAKFCSVCGSPVVPVQQPELASQVEIDSVFEDIVTVSAEADSLEMEAVTAGDVKEAAESVEPAGEEFAPESYEIPVYNSEMTMPEVSAQVEVPAQEDVSTQVDIPAQEEIPVEAVAQMPPVASAESQPEIPPVAPVYPGFPMYGVPTGQMYNGIPVYAMPNVPMYNGAPNAQVNNTPNAQPYNGAPVYPPMYNMPGYGAPVQAYPGGPVYAAPMYAPQGAPMYAAPGYYGAEPVKEKPKTVSILALLGSLAAIVALFLNLIKNTESSVFKIISESLPDMFDMWEYIDRFSTLEYLILAVIAVSILCVLFAVLVFIFACLKKKCRGTSIIAMLLIVSLIAVFFVCTMEMYGGYIEADFDTILNVIKGLDVGFWLYLGGMFVAAIGGGKR